MAVLDPEWRQNLFVSWQGRLSSWSVQVQPSSRIDTYNAGARNLQDVYPMINKAHESENIKRECPYPSVVGEESNAGAGVGNGMIEIEQGNGNGSTIQISIYYRKTIDIMMKI